jgi:hypothetical protein
MFGWKLANHLFTSGLKPEPDPDENLTMNGHQITKPKQKNPCGLAFSDTFNMFDKPALDPHRLHHGPSKPGKSLLLFHPNCWSKTTNHYISKSIDLDSSL